MRQLALRIALVPGILVVLAICTVAGPFAPLLQAGHIGTASDDHVQVSAPTSIRGRSNPPIKDSAVPTVPPQAPRISASPTALLEIPSSPSMQGWSETPIRDTAEPLVSLVGISPRVVVVPNCLDPRLRKGAADRLVSAAQRLPEGYRLLVVDAHRTMAQQRVLFENARARFARQYPGKSDREILEITEKYVSTPSLDPRTPPPHTTGGAVDISILGPDGELALGPDGHQAESATDYFKGRDSHTDVHQNRRLLYTVMVEAGFTNYPQEWWHYDYGNQFWGHLSGRNAIYGLAK